LEHDAAWFKVVSLKTGFWKNHSRPPENSVKEGSSRIAKDMSCDAHRSGEPEKILFGT
jgi:hypothetical protein